MVRREKLEAPQNNTMSSSQTTLDFMGGNTSETMPANLVPISANASKDVYLVREAMYRDVSSSTASPYAVLGQPTKDAMNVDRGDLVFMDRLMSGTVEYSLTGSSMPIVFNTMVGMSFNLQFQGKEYRIMHNGTLYDHSQSPPQPVSDPVESHRLLNAMLYDRYEDVRFAGVALSKWTIDDQRQSNAGIAVATSGTIAVLNSTGRSIRMGQLLCLRVPEWTDQFGGSGLNASYPNNNYPDDLDLSGSARNRIGRPTLALYPSRSVRSKQVIQDEAMSIVRVQLTAVRTAINKAGRLFGTQMGLVRDDVQAAMLTRALGGPGPNLQNAIDPTVGGGRADFGAEWLAIDTAVSTIANADALHLSNTNKHDAYLAVLAEFLRIHDPIWTAVTGVPVGNADITAREAAFFDAPGEVAHRFTDLDQGSRRAITHIQELYTAQSTSGRNTLFEPARGAVNQAVIDTQATETRITPNTLTTYTLATLQPLVQPAVDAAHDLWTAVDNVAEYAFPEAGGPQLQLVRGGMRDDLLDAVVPARDALRVLLSPLELANNWLSASTAKTDVSTLIARAKELIAATPIIVTAAATAVPADPGDAGARGVLLSNYPNTADIGPGYPGPAAVVNTALDAAIVNVTVSDARNRIQLAITERLKLNALTEPDPMPAETVNALRLGVDPIPAINAARQAAVITALDVDKGVALGALTLANNGVFVRELQRLHDAGEEHLRGYIRDWEIPLKKTFARVVGLIHELNDKFMGTAHAQLLFERQTVEDLIEDPDIRQAFKDFTLPRLDFASGMESDPFLRKWVSLERSTLEQANFIRQTARGDHALTLSDLLADATDPGNQPAIDNAVRDAVLLYMVYNTSIVDEMPAVVRYINYFAHWPGGRGALLPLIADAAAEFSAKRWFEQPMFKAIDGADAGSLMRVSILA